MNEKDQSIRFTQEYYSTGCNLKEPDVFRREYPDHVKRIAMAVPVVVNSTESQIYDVARLYEVNIEFLIAISNYYAN